MQKDDITIRFEDAMEGVQSNIYLIREMLKAQMYELLQRQCKGATQEIMQQTLEMFFPYVQDELITEVLNSLDSNDGYIEGEDLDCMPPA